MAPAAARTGVLLAITTSVLMLDTPEPELPVWGRMTSAPAVAVVGLRNP